MGIKPVQRQSLITFIAQISFTLIGFLSTIYFAHTVDESVLGAYFLFIAYLGIINIVTEGGFGGAAIKRISEGEDQDAYFSAFFSVRLVFLVIAILVLIAVRKYFVDLDSEGLFVWLLLALVASLVYGIVSGGVAGCGKMGIYSSCNFISNVSRIIIQVIAVYLGFEIAGLAGGFVAGLFIAAIIELRFLDLHFVRFGRKHIKNLLAFSFWLFLTSSGVILYSHSDIIMIGYFMDNTDVRVYKLVFQFTTLAIVATTALRATLWPKVSYWGKIDDMNYVEQSLSRALIYSLLLAVPVLIGGILLGDKLLYFFYRIEPGGGYVVLVILLFVQIINVFQFFFLMYLGALDHQKDSFKVTAVAVTANIILNLLLIPVIGIIGAAVATFVTMLLNAVLGRLILSRIMIIQVDYSSIFNIIKASVVMALFVMGYRLIVPLYSVWVTMIPVVLGGMLYVVLVLRFDRGICKELKRIVTQMNLPWPGWL